MRVRFAVSRILELEYKTFNITKQIVPVWEGNSTSSN